MSGSIHKRGDAGWWFVRLYWQKKYYTFAWYHNDRMYSEKIAQRLLNQIQGDIERGVFNPLRYTKGQSPVSAFLWEWWELHESQWAPATSAAYKSYIKIHLEPYFKYSKVVIQEIRKPVLDKLLKDLRAKGVSGLTCHHIINGCLRACIRYAWESELIDHMPPFPRRKEYGIQRKSVRYISLETQAAIIEAMEECHRPIFLWLSYHMRRPSEAMALRKSDYDPENRVFHLQHGRSFNKNVDHIKTTDEHILPCHGAMVDFFDRYKSDHPFSPYMFTNPCADNKDKQYNESSLFLIWRRACEKVGVFQSTPPCGGRLSHSNMMIYHSENEIMRESIENIVYSLFDCQRSNCKRSNGQGMPMPRISVVLMRTWGSRLPSNDQRSFLIDGFLGADMFDPTLPIGAEIIEAQTVHLGFDLVYQTLFKRYPLSRFDDAFKYRKLHPLAVVLAGLGHTPEPRLASHIGDRNIIGNEYEH